MQGTCVSPSGRCGSYSFNRCSPLLWGSCPQKTACFRRAGGGSCHLVGWRKALCQTCIKGSGGSARVEGPQGTFWLLEGLVVGSNTPTGSFSRMSLSALSFCQSCQTICLLLNPDKRAPSLALTWLALLASLLLQAGLQACVWIGHLYPQPALTPVPVRRAWGGLAVEASLPLEESGWGLALGPQFFGSMPE